MIHTFIHHSIGERRLLAKQYKSHVGRLLGETAEVANVPADKWNPVDIGMHATYGAFHILLGAGDALVRDGGRLLARDKSPVESARPSQTGQRLHEMGESIRERRLFPLLSGALSIPGDVFDDSLRVGFGVKSPAKPV